MDNRYDLTHNFENVIYNELLYMGYSLQVYHDGSHEIDFVARKGNKQYYIQVAYSVAEEKTYEREFGAFAKLDNSCQISILAPAPFVISSLGILSRWMNYDQVGW